MHLLAPGTHTGYRPILADCSKERAAVSRTCQISAQVLRRLSIPHTIVISPTYIPGTIDSAVRMKGGNGGCDTLGRR